jgi:predicted DNA-binding transcriptional regulator YafY
MNERKSRILTIKHYLETHADEQHPVTIADIITHLGQAGFACGWKSVKNDIDQLIDSGVDIVCNKGRELQYFIGDRHFELPEVKLLIDAVQASRFISVTKSKRLIKKLTAFASRHQAAELNRTLYTDKQIKANNENIFVTVDKLHAAINGGRQIHFMYYEYDPHKRKNLKHKRQVYRFSPYAMLWNGDNYYTVGHSESHGKIITFRVDRIAAPELKEHPAVPKPKDFDPAFYAQKVFQMYDGELRVITLRCENSLMKSVVDRFGEKVETSVIDAEHFQANVSVCASPTFYGWVFGFAGKMRITAPRDILNEYISLAACATDKSR